MMNQVTDVLEEGLWVVGCELWVVGCSMFDVRCSMFDVGFDLRSGFVHFVNPVCPDPFHHASFPASPCNVEHHATGGMTRGEHQHRIRTRHVPPSGTNFLALPRMGAID